MAVFVPVKPEELVHQTELGLLGNGDDLGWLSLTASFEDKGRAGVVAVVPGGLHQEAAHVDIAGLGDRAAVLSIAGGVLRRDQAEVGHEGARGSEAPHVANLDQQSKGSEGLDASETAECFYGFPVVWKSRIAFQLCVEGRLFCLQILQVL